MAETWIASDWHLAPRTPPGQARLARLFLARARAAGVRVVLNGDVFEDLFAGAPEAAAAHPGVAAELRALAAEGRLVRTRGNHDPAAGEDHVVLELPGLGRVLVAHGHAADPLARSALGRLGDAISSRFGRFAAVRGAARLAERTARALAEERLLALFRRRCLALVDAAGCDLGVFGHVHRAHLVPGDRYLNAGALSADGLGYLVLAAGQARLAAVRPDDDRSPPRESGGAPDDSKTI